MSYGRNPNSVPYGGVGRTSIPLPSASVKVIKHPMLERKAVVEDGREDTSSDYGSVDPNYMEDGTVESSDGQKSGIWQSLVGTPAQPGDEEVDIIEGDPETADAVIYGTDEGGTNGISDATIDGDADFGSGELSDEEMDKVIFGDDSLDDVIEGKDEPEMSDEDFRRTVYGDDPEEPEPPKTKKVVYRVSKQKNTPQQRQTNTGLGMIQ